jgi:hypothetical protein
MVARLVLLVGVLLTFGLFLAAPSSAHWAGFTGDNWWYCSTSWGLQSRCESPEVHSYWFASVKKDDGGGALWVCAQVRSNNWKAGAGCATDFARACGGFEPYPNCHDQDGFSARPAISHDDRSQNRRLQGHGAY